MRNITTVLLVIFSFVFFSSSASASAENYSEYLDSIQTQNDYNKAWQKLIEELQENYDAAYSEYVRKREEIKQKNPIDIYALQEEQEKFKKENKALFDLYKAKKEVLRTSFEANRVK